MDKVALVIKDGAPSLRGMSNEKLDAEVNVTVSQEELHDKRILMYIDSCEFQFGVLNARDDNIEDITMGVLQTLPALRINHEGKQGENLLKLLSALAPDKEAHFRRALMLNKDMLKVFEDDV